MTKTPEKAAADIDKQARFWLQTALPKLLGDRRTPPRISEPDHDHYALAFYSEMTRNLPSPNVLTRAHEIIEPAINAAMGLKSGAEMAVEASGDGQRSLVKIYVSSHLPKGLSVETLSERLWENKAQILSGFDFPGQSKMKQ